MPVALEIAPSEPRDSLVQRATDWVFGYDYFISYSHRDGKNYPRLLKERLERSGFRVFLDQTEYAPGTNLARETRRQVLKSKVIVVIGREGALASPWVKREVDIALAHRRDPVVIDINGAMARAQSGAGIVDTVRREHWLRLMETVAQVPNDAGVLIDDGEPTDRAVSELIRSFGHTRQQRIRYRLLAGVAIVMGVLAVVASQQAVVARLAQAKAEQERISAEIANERLIARTAVSIADGGDGTAATQLALESAMALRLRRDHPDAKTALAEAHLALHTAHYARREFKVMPGDAARGTAIEFAPDGQRLAVAKASGVLEVYDRNGALIFRSMHRSAINSVTFSPDGSRVLTASRDGSSVQWNAATGARIGMEMNHAGGVNRATYDRQGALVLTAGQDGTAALWSAVDGSPVRTLPVQPAAIADARFAPDGETIVTASEDFGVRLWRTADGSPELAADGSPRPSGKERHQNPLRQVSFSPNGRYLVSSGRDHYAVVWDLQTGTSRRLIGHEDTLFGAAFDPASRVVLTFSEDFTARLWAADSGAFLARLQHDAWVQSGVFSPDGSEVLTASKENTTRIWDAKSGELKVLLSGHNSSEKLLLLAAYDPRGEFIATTSWDGTTRLWKADAGVDIKVIDTGLNQVVAAAFNRDDKLVAAGGAGNLNTGYLGVWSSQTGKRVLGPVTTPGRIWRVSFHPHRDTLAAAAGWGGSTLGSRVVLLDLPTEKLEMRTHSPPAATARALRSVQYSADGKWLASAGEDGAARIWSVETGEPAGSPFDHGGRIQLAVFDQAGQQLATGGYDGQIKVWNLRDRSHRLLRHAVRERVFNMAFTRDARRLLVSLGNGEVGFWDLTSQSPSFKPLARMSFEAWAAALSSDEKLVAVGDLGRRGTTIVLDAVNGNQIAVLKGQTGGIRATDFTSDGRRLLTASNDGTIWIWPLFATGDELIERAGAMLHRCLSRRERTALGLSAPPGWCITGWGLEGEADPAKWKPKWPYDTPAWRQWLIDARTNPEAPLPQ